MCDLQNGESVYLVRYSWDGNFQIVERTVTRAGVKTFQVEDERYIREFKNRCPWRKSVKEALEYAIAQREDGLRSANRQVVRETNLLNSLQEEIQKYV